jgi:hypothetical protein
MSFDFLSLFGNTFKKISGGGGDMELGNPSQAKFQVGTLFRGLLGWFEGNGKQV